MLEQGWQAALRRRERALYQPSPVRTNPTAPRGPTTGWRRRREVTLPAVPRWPCARKA